MTLEPLSDVKLDARRTPLSDAKWATYMTRGVSSYPRQLTRRGECQLTPDNLRNWGSGVHRGDPASGVTVEGPESEDEGLGSRV